MTQHWNRKQAFVGASEHRFARPVLVLAALMLLCGGVPAEAQHTTAAVQARTARFPRHSKTVPCPASPTSSGTLAQEESGTAVTTR